MLSACFVLITEFINRKTCGKNGVVLKGSSYSADDRLWKSSIHARNQLKFLSAYLHEKGRILIRCIECISCITEEFSKRAKLRYMIPKLHIRLPCFNAILWHSKRVLRVQSDMFSPCFPPIINFLLTSIRSKKLYT